MKEKLNWKILESTVKYLTYRGSLKRIPCVEDFEEVKFKYRGLVWEQNNVENNSSKNDSSEIKTSHQGAVCTN